METSINDLARALAWKIQKMNRGWLTIYNLKMSALSSTMGGCVVPPFGQRKPFGLGVWSLAGHAAQVSFQNVICDLCLAVCLRVVGCGVPEVDAKNTKQFLSYFTQKGWITVTDD